MVKKSTGSALNNLLGKLEAQKSKPNTPLGIGALAGIGGAIAGVTVSNPQVSNPQVSNPFTTPTLRSDPLNMKSRPSVRKGRKAKRSSSSVLRQQAQAQAISRHRGGTYSTGTDVEDQDEDQDEDLKTNIDFIDENKLKTMDWTEPDGSKTTLKFDENGTLIGKETTKSRPRPDKFSRDLKKAVDKNAVALKDYEESLMTDPVQ